MKTPAAAPYLLPPDSAIVAQEWTNEDGIEIGDRLDHWDPFTDLRLVRTVDVDVDLIRSACLLQEDSAFALTATWSSTTTRIAGQGPLVELGIGGGLLRAALRLEVPGARVGGRLDLNTRLVLRFSGQSPSPISPQRPGATLWTEENRIALEGMASRFPITLTDFSSSARYPASAGWVLEWNHEDLDAPVLGGMRLLVNRSHESLVGALRTGSSDASAASVRSFVTFDVGRGLISGALANDRFVENPDVFTEGSVGRMLSELIALCWPGVPAASLRARSVDDPARFSGELQGYFGVVG